MPNEASPLVEKISKQTYLYGNDPQRHFVGINPFKTSLVKVQVAGETRFVCVNVRSFFAAQRKEGTTEHMSFSSMIDYFQNLTVERAKELVKHGMIIKHAVQTPLDCLHIPGGWIALEKTTKGSLVYGVRRSFVVELWDQQPTAYNRWR